MILICIIMAATNQNNSVRRTKRNEKSNFEKKIGELILELKKRVLSFFMFLE